MLDNLQKRFAMSDDHYMSFNFPAQLFLAASFVGFEISPVAVHALAAMSAKPFEAASIGTHNITINIQWSISLSQRSYLVLPNQLNTSNFLVLAKKNLLLWKWTQVFDAVLQGTPLLRADSVQSCNFRVLVCIRYRVQSINSATNHLGGCILSNINTRM